MDSINKTDFSELITDKASQNVSAELSVGENTSAVEDQKTESTTSVVSNYSTLSNEELIEALKKCLNQEVEEVKNDVESIKQAFYRNHRAEVENQKKLFLENGGVEEDFVPKPNELEETFKSLLKEFRDKKAEHLAKVEKEKQENLLKKQQILEKMKILADAKDDVSTHINEFRALQQEWKSIGQVPPSSLSDLFKQYNAYQEAFWDLIKINNELREYDFKKNLEAKTQICEAAEKLMDEPDVVTAFQQLQKLHNEWHETGPVSRELREEIWQRFKNASTVVNKKHQTYFESIRKIEDDNLVAKTALCEKIESIDFSVLKTFSEWEEATKSVLALQDEWRTIGFAPRKLNQKVFERYRHACDAFFSAKAEFYKQVRNSYAENYRKKVELCEKAESLKDNTDWKETSEKFIQLQKEWKAIGPVPRKYSDELWKRFISACDYFFDQKQKNINSLHGEELENLEKKKNLIAKINSLQKSDHTNETVASLKALIEEWTTIGHVPFKEKDKIYKDFRAAVDKKYEELNIDWVSRRLDTFKNNLKDMNTKGQSKLIHERDKLLHARERLNSEIATYENNLGYFTSTTQKGSKVILELERKIDTLKEESRLIEEKIRLIEDSL
jgi:pterin-4a-carbinolamine dehydratase